MTDSKIEELILTREEIEDLEKEREYLVSTKRSEIAERIKEAISYGDISENAEYDAAKNEQAEMEERIQKLEDMIRRARVVEETDNDVVNIGMTVIVRNLADQRESSYSLVGTTGADPFKGRISNESAVGKALIGHKVGDRVTIEIPSGITNYEVVNIERTGKQKRREL